MHECVGWSPRRNTTNALPPREAGYHRGGGGVDGSKKALSAVRWGAVEAANRQLPLHLVHALDPTDAANALPSALSCSLDSARTSLREAREVALSTRSGLDVDCILAHGRPADVLAGTGHPSMICVGRPARRRRILVTTPASPPSSSWPRTAR